MGNAAMNWTVWSQVAGTAVDLNRVLTPVGDGPLERQVRRAVDRRGLAGRLHLVGVSYKAADVVEAMRAALAGRIADLVARVRFGGEGRRAPLRNFTARRLLRETVSMCEVLNGLAAVSPARRA